MKDPKIVRFHYSHPYQGYVCSEPGDMDGEYVSIEEYKNLLKEELENMKKLKDSMIIQMEYLNLLINIRTQIGDLSKEMNIKTDESETSKAFSERFKFFNLIYKIFLQIDEIITKEEKNGKEAS